MDELHKWIADLHISKPVKCMPRDFSDAVLLAEIIAHFLPRYLSLSSFAHVNSVALKRYNWETLQKVVLRHLDIQLDALQIQRLANAEPGLIELVLLKVKGRIDDALRAGRFRPSGRRSRSASTASSRSGSTLHLNRLDEEKIAQKMVAGSETEKATPTAIKGVSVLEDFTKDQMIEKLYSRIRVLENSLSEKEDKIQSLSRQVSKLLEIVCRDGEAKSNGANFTDSSGPGSETPSSPNGTDLSHI